MADEIFTGLTQYFDEEPPEGSYVAWKKNGGITSLARSDVTRRYTIRRGDTLSHIAKKHKVSVTDIRRLNGIKNNRIQVGQKIKLPAS
jgi:N-acetylmuramoyl-L-alanine amidase